MVINLGMNWENFYKDNIMSYIKSLQENPLDLITLIIDTNLSYDFFPKNRKKTNLSIDSISKSSNSSNRFVNGGVERS